MTSEPNKITFVDPDVQRCPFNAYRKLQQDARVYLDPGTGMYELLDYADLRKTCLDQLR